MNFTRPLTKTVALIVFGIATFCAGSDSLFGQLSLVQVAFPSGDALDVSAYPKIRARVRATYSGQPASLTRQGVYLLEGNVSFLPENIIAETQGVHVVEWTTSQFNSFGTLNQPTRLAFASTMLAFASGSTATTSFSATLPLSNGAKVVVRDSMSRIVPLYIEFGTVGVGMTDTVKLKLVATEAAREGVPPQERMVHIESISTRSNKFKVNWKSTMGTPAPPVDIYSPLEYRFDVICVPTSDSSISDVLTVVYEGGMRTDIILTANPSTYPRRTVLSVVTPNGGEAFAPCQEVPITWRGMVPGFKAYVEFSADSGKSWKMIDSTLDSSLVWTVPQVITDRARIRVYQAFQSLNPVWLDGEPFAATNAAYSSDGKYVAVAFANGVVQEFDVTTNAKANKYRVSLPNGMRVNALTYVGRTRDIITLSNSLTSGGGELDHFTAGVSTSDANVSIPNDVSVANVCTDPAGTMTYALPQRSGRILRFDPQTLVADQPIILTAAAQTSSFNANTITVMQFDGFVVQYDATTGTETDRKQTGLPGAHGPVVRKSAGSLSGRLVGLAGQTAQVSNGPKEQRTFVFDLQTQQIVKLLYRESSEVINLSFSPNDAFLVLGFQFNPQFVVYDLLTAKTLPPNGTADGHNNDLTDLAFSPDGSSIVSTSSDQSKNVLLRRVNTPESDMSDEVFVVNPVQLSIQQHTLRSLLVGTTEDIVVTDVCNNGTVMAEIERGQLMFGSWLSLKTPFVKDTLMPGECLRLEFTAAPLDTGLLVDSLVLTTCGTDFKVPFEIRALDRDLTMLFDLEDFGDVCIGERASKRLALIRNNDSVSVVINAVFMQDGLASQFRVATSFVDTLLAPGESLVVEIEFVPRQLGYDTSTVTVHYANQSIISKSTLVKGRGAGADVVFSHKTLAFIPEIPSRDLIIKNASDNPITIDSAYITPGEPFTLVTGLPVTIASKDSAVLIVQYNGGSVGPSAFLRFAIAPCATLASEPTVNDVKLALYSGTASVQLPYVIADPRSDTTSIPIIASITEQPTYNGIRFFEGVMRVNPRLYLAREVTSTIGTGEIISQDIVSGLREIRFRINADFHGLGEIGRIVGYAGMAEVDSSVLEFDPTQIAFGSSVTSTYTSGMLKIEHPDPIRRVIDNSRQTIIEQITPQPASDFATVDVSIADQESASITIVDANGTTIYGPVRAIANMQVNGRGHAIVQIPASELPSGVHVFVVHTNTFVASKPFVVVH